MKRNKPRLIDLRLSIAERERETNSLEERLNSTKTLDELSEWESELRRQNEEVQAIIDDQNGFPKDKEAVELRVAERNEELTRFANPDWSTRKGVSSTRKNERNFKKYAVTVTSILLAAGVTIGVAVGTVTNALKATGKA